MFYKQDKKLKNEEEKIRQEPITLEIWIESKDLGVLLGRQGSNLREIQSRSNTRIWFLDANSSSITKSKFFIRGAPDDVQYAEILIHQTISTQPKLEKCMIKIPLAAESSLLGKQGERKRRLEVKSRCKLEVNKDSAINSGDEISIILRGTKDQLDHGKKLVEEAIQEHLYIFNKVKKNNNQQALSYKQPLFVKYEEQGDQDCDDTTSANIGQETLSSTGSDQLVQVYVSSLADPARFWVQNVGPASIELDKLTENMTQYYSRQENQLFHRLDTVCAGDIVVAVYSGDSSFYRARVQAYNLDEYDSALSTVDLDFVDYGDCEVKPISEIYEIRSEYLKLNFQAITCKLARIRPMDSGSNTWSEECIDEFESLSCCALWKPIYAKIISSGGNNNTFGEVERDKADSNVATVELFTLEGERNIGEELVKQGFARIVR